MEEWDEVPPLPGEETVKARTSAAPPTAPRRGAQTRAVAPAVQESAPAQLPTEDPAAALGEDPWAEHNASNAAKAAQRPRGVPPWANAYPSGPPKPQAPGDDPESKARALREKARQLRRELESIEAAAADVANVR